MLGNRPCPITQPVRADANDNGNKTLDVRKKISDEADSVSLYRGVTDRA